MPSQRKILQKNKIMEKSKNELNIEEFLSITYEKI